MLLSKLVEQNGSAPLEFVVLSSLFLAPFLAASQTVSESHLRQLSVAAAASQLARQLALSPTENPEKLVALLESDASSGKLDVEHWCSPDAKCSTRSLVVTVRVKSGEQTGLASSMISDEGSILLPMLGIFALAFGLLLTSTNIQSARIADFKAQEVADLLAMSTYQSEVSRGPSLQQTVVALLRNLNGSTGEKSSIDNYSVVWAERNTLEATVCIRYFSFYNLFTWGHQPSLACAIAKVRNIGAHEVLGMNRGM